MTGDTTPGSFLGEEIVQLVSGMWKSDIYEVPLWNGHSSVLNETLNLILQVVLNFLELLEITEPVLVIFRKFVVWVVFFFVVPIANSISTRIIIGLETRHDLTYPQEQICQVQNHRLQGESRPPPRKASSPSSCSPSSFPQTK